MSITFESDAEAALWERLICAAVASTPLPVIGSVLARANMTADMLTLADELLLGHRARRAASYKTPGEFPVGAAVAVQGTIWTKPGEVLARLYVVRCPDGTLAEVGAGHLSTWPEK